MADIHALGDHIHAGIFVIPHGEPPEAAILSARRHLPYCVQVIRGGGENFRILIFENLS
jgi:hypothetical protein